MAEQKRKDWGPTVFRAGAISNWAVTIGAIFTPQIAVEWILQMEGMHYFFLMRIWSGMAFLWGILFWQIAKDMDGYKRVIWFSWTEKLITTTAVSIATFTGEIATPWCFVMILFTDVLWIPLFFYYDMRTRGNPQAATALAHARRTLELDPA